MLKHFGIFNTEEEVKGAVSSKKLEEPWIVYIENSSRLVYSINNELDIIVPDNEEEEQEVVIDLDTVSVLKFNLDKIYYLSNNGGSEPIVA